MDHVVCREPRNRAVRAECKLRSVDSVLALAGIRVCPPAQNILRTDGLGRPELTTGYGQPAAVSFSWQEDTLWTALSLLCPRIGIDAALCADFNVGYPFAKIFNACEWQASSALLKAGSAHAASFLWSVKEATVKMLGCGFNFVEPRRICVMISRSDGQLLHSCVEIPSGRWAGKVNVYSMEYQWGWVSLALFDPGGSKSCHRFI
ncbi:MAG: 4'-phosphopantetheinyl transferase superfamily protein [Syntrophobacteraceae bacterium]